MYIHGAQILLSGLQSLTELGTNSGHNQPTPTKIAMVLIQKINMVIVKTMLITN